MNQWLKQPTNSINMGIEVILLRLAYLCKKVTRKHNCCVSRSSLTGSRGLFDIYSGASSWDNLYWITTQEGLLVVEYLLFCLHSIPTVSLGASFFYSFLEYWSIECGSPRAICVAVISFLYRLDEQFSNKNTVHLTLFAMPLGRQGDLSSCWEPQASLEAQVTGIFSPRMHSFHRHRWLAWCK